MRRIISGTVAPSAIPKGALNFSQRSEQAWANTAVCDGIGDRSGLRLEGSVASGVALSPEPNHAEILRSGPTAWNAWRENNPSTIPDLAGIALNLSERQMGPISGGPINLRSARLQDAGVPLRDPVSR